jgi:hypothetical protein
MASGNGAIFGLFIIGWLLLRHLNKFATQSDHFALHSPGILHTYICVGLVVLYREFMDER